MTTPCTNSQANHTPNLTHPVTHPWSHNPTLVMSKALPAAPAQKDDAALSSAKIDSHDAQQTTWQILRCTEHNTTAREAHTHKPQMAEGSTPNPTEQYPGPKPRLDLEWAVQTPRGTRPGIVHPPPAPSPSGRCTPSSGCHVGYNRVAGNRQHSDVLRERCTVHSHIPTTDASSALQVTIK
jgi:hypothetical protein